MIRKKNKQVVVFAVIISDSAYAPGSIVPSQLELILMYPDVSEFSTGTGKKRITNLYTF